MLRTWELEDMELDEENPFEGILAATAFGIRSTYHTTLQASPGQLVFGRDMVLNIQHIANWRAIAERKQKLINQNNERENKKRISHQYQIGDKVLLNRLERVLPKLRINTTEKTINIRNINPYHG